MEMLPMLLNHLLRHPGPIAGPGDKGSRGFPFQADSETDGACIKKLFLEQVE